MILQALAQYYKRKSENDIDSIAREGFEYKEIPYVVVLDRNGDVFQIEVTYQGEGKAKRAKSFLVPKGIKKSSGIASNLLWENPEYALGVKIKSDEQRIVEMRKAFIDKLMTLGEIDDEGLKALNLFLSKGNNINSDDLKTIAEDKKAIITFKLQGENNIIAESDTVKKAIESLQSDGDNKARCLITGEEDNIKDLHDAIKGVWGAQASGGNIVSFNLPAFRSYGKEQGYNAPCGEKAIFAYTTALNSLLGKDSTQRMQVGDASMVFWSAKQNDFEKMFPLFFMMPKDNLDVGTNAVKALFESINNGSINNDDSKQEFYVLGLSPNAARISVRFFIKDTIKGMSENIVQHFKDLEIVKPSFENEFLPLFKLLVLTAVQSKAENIAPHLEGDFMMSILKGLPYPATLLQAVINRIKAEQNINYARAALIKAYINRFRGKEEIKVALDKENTNRGYVLGRLFATFEKLQEEAQGETNSTIMRFYGSASSTPIAVFANLMRLHQHHLDKLSKENRGLAINREKLIGEIMNKISINGDIAYPANLSLIDQGNFSVGYYHQRQDFFKTKGE